MLIVGVALVGASDPAPQVYSTSGEELARQKQREILATTYERTLASLRDVDEDHLTGKLAERITKTERAYWTDQGVAGAASAGKSWAAKNLAKRRS